MHRLRREGLSIRSIANALGLSRMKVHRLLTTAADDGDPDPWDDGDDLALFDAEDDDPGCVEPFTYVGTERVWCSGAKGEGGRWSDERRYVDGTGRSVGELDFYRWCQYRRYDHGDLEGAARVEADVQRQIQAAERLGQL